MKNSFGPVMLTIFLMSFLSHTTLEMRRNFITSGAHCARRGPSPIVDCGFRVHAFRSPRV